MTSDKLNIAAITSEIDLPARRWTPDSLHSAYLKFGCAVVRGCVNRALLWRIGNLVDAAYRANGEPRHVDENDIQRAAWVRPAPFKLVSHPLLQQFMARIFDGTYKTRFVMARRIRGSK